MAKASKIEEILREAAAAVAAADVPDDLRAVAYKEAVDFLREAEGSSKGGGGGNANGTSSSSKTRTSAATKTADEADASPPDEAAFFAQLAEESGVGEQDLRDVLTLAEGTVHVTPPARRLGASAAEQAKTVIALVSGARAYGLRERPVRADAVRREVERKNCYQRNNFSSKHLGPLDGFNAGANRDEIVLTSKWVGEFKSAVDRARGHTPPEDKS